MPKRVTLFAEHVQDFRGQSIGASKQQYEDLYLNDQHGNFYAVYAPGGTRDEPIITDGDLIVLEKTRRKVVDDKSMYYWKLVEE